MNFSSIGAQLSPPTSSVMHRVNHSATAMCNLSTTKMHRNVYWIARLIHPYYPQMASSHPCRLLLSIKTVHQPRIICICVIISRNIQESRLIIQISSKRKKRIFKISLNSVSKKNSVKLLVFLLNLTRNSVNHLHLSALKMRVMLKRLFNFYVIVIMQLLLFQLFKILNNNRLINNNYNNLNNSNYLAM